MSDRFHRAARDGYLEVLREATRRDCNAPDEDGLTPTLWAAYEGNLDALRQLVGRGGDPDKCDHYGNTALHCAAARGHMTCVSFLVNFGVNIWALDNEFHTAKELAAMNNKDDILRYLDTVAGKQKQADAKQVKKLQDKAQKDSEKRRKDSTRSSRSVTRREAENLRLEKERLKIEKQEVKPQEGRRKSIMNTLSRSSIAFMNGPRKDSRLLYDTNSPKFSDLTNTNNPKKNLGGIQKKIIKKKVQDENKSDFKVRETEGDGKRSVRSLSGFRRDSEILFVPNGSLSSTNSGKRGKISDVFETEDGNEDGRLHRTASQPDFYEISEPNMQHRGSLFARPGFGSVAFRYVSAAHTHTNTHAGCACFSYIPERISPQDLPSDDESEATPVYLFLAAAGLTDFIPTFAKEHIDLDALMLLTEEDLISMKLPLGPRRKLLKAIKERNEALEDPGEVQDSQL
ncbi:Usher syndrome type-1G protein homolog [Penaeus japonicus]|uniref:Usher syndrome type-1G protein homolog n=1 Tax=Penaeus japonicus TaxID=27405 RepID=UPI001C70E408|nr:Usher syndrome type-1G protein homolog [Penaeus japonicus]